MKDCKCYCCTKVSDFSIKMGNTSILHDINLHLHCGQLTAIIGPNGAGKSTLLKSLIGSIPYTGILEFINEEGKGNTPKIGYVPQRLSVENNLPISVMDMICANISRRPICFGASKKAVSAATTLLENTDCAHLKNKRLCELSGGELQRVMLAFALMPIPNLLLLDEPVSGLDYNGIEDFWNTISRIRKKYDLAIIIVSHDFEQVQKYADAAVLLNKTIIENGNPSEVINSKGFKGLFNYG